MKTGSRLSHILKHYVNLYAHAHKLTHPARKRLWNLKRQSVV